MFIKSVLSLMLLGRWKALGHISPGLETNKPVNEMDPNRFQSFSERGALSLAPSEVEPSPMSPGMISRSSTTDESDYKGSIGKNKLEDNRENFCFLCLDTIKFEMPHAQEIKIGGQDSRCHLKAEEVTNKSFLQRHQLHMSACGHITHCKCIQKWIEAGGDECGICKKKFNSTDKAPFMKFDNALASVSTQSPNKNQLEINVKNLENLIIIQNSSAGQTSRTIQESVQENQVEHSRTDSSSSLACLMCQCGFVYCCGCFQNSSPFAVLTMTIELLCTIIFGVKYHDSHNSHFRIAFYISLALFVIDYLFHWIKYLIYVSQSDSSD